MESVHWTRCCSNSSNQKFSSEYQFHLIKTDFCWSQKDCNCNGYFFSKYIFTKLAFNRICANNRQKEGNYHCESHSICKTRANDLQILQPICFGTPICICICVFILILNIIIFMFANNWQRNGQSVAVTSTNYAICCPGSLDSSSSCKIGNKFCISFSTIEQ